MSSLWAMIWDIRPAAVQAGKIILKRISPLVVACLVALAVLLPVSSKDSEAGAGKKGKDPSRLVVTPDGSIDSNGSPTLGDVFEFIDRNPDKAMELLQDSGQWPYLTVAAGIIATHDAVMAGGGRPIPAHLRKTLRRWYPDELLNAVRWIRIQEPILRFLQDANMNFGADTLAITVMNAVIFRSDDLANDGALWAHELYHVQQYRDWGVFGFAKKWVDNPSVSGPVEAPAYARQAQARPFFSPR